MSSLSNNVCPYVINVAHSYIHAIFIAMMYHTSHLWLKKKKNTHTLLSNPDPLTFTIGGSYDKIRKREGKSKVLLRSVSKHAYVR